MSRGGRGGRGGGNFQGGRPAGLSLPFEIDAKLLEAVEQNNREDQSSDEDRNRELFPVSDPIVRSDVNVRPF